MKRLAVTLCALAALAAASLPAAFAQDYPTRPIKLIVPFPPGGTLDVTGRLVAQKLQESLGQPVIVESKGGAAGTIGSDFVAKSEPDGYTLLINSTPFITTPHLMKLPYDIKRDFVGVAQMLQIEYVLVVSPKLGVNNIRELVELAQRQPGKLNYSSAGNGSGQHLYVELFKSASKVDLVHVPYKGNGPALQAFLTGEVDMIFDTTAGVLQHIAAGRAKPVLVTGNRSIEALPGVPPLETVYPGLGIDAWHGIFAPAKTPKAIVDKLGEAIRAAVNQPDTAKRIRDLGFTPTGITSERFNPMFQRDVDAWGRVIRENNVKSD
jgi:tripartite-type tricarboxylate transporter receptor subunit TctC